MPRGKSLSEYEQGEIAGLKANDPNISCREIARRIGREKTVVANFLKLGAKYGKKKRSGRPPTVSERDKRNIRRLAVNKSLSSAEITRELVLPVTSRRTRQILEADSNIKYKPVVAAPALKKHHKLARLKFAKNFQFWEDEWKAVIFSDEKKWNLDGPDGLRSCWQDTRSNKRKIVSRNVGGGSVMVWAAFCHNGTSPLCFISSKMNSDSYIELLDDVLITFGEDKLGEEWTFQHDNAAIHASKKTKTFLEGRGIPVLPWPACSPDLNPIENIWGLLSQKVYAHGRQFDTVRQLKEALLEEWNRLDPEILKSLIDSMPRRLQHVIIAKGDNSYY